MTVAEAFVYFIVKTGDTESVFMTRVRQTDVCEQFGRLVHRVTNNGGKMLSMSKWNFKPRR